MAVAKNFYNPTGIILLFILFFFSSVPARSQDIIKFKSGREVKAVIVDVDSVAIKYREFSDPSGPLYSARKELIDSFIYGKGRKPVTSAAEKNLPAAKSNKQVPENASDSDSLWVKKRHVMQGYTVISPRNVKEILENNQDALELYEKGLKQVVMGNNCAYGIMIVTLSASLLQAGTEDMSEIRTYAAVALAIDAGLVTTAIVLNSSGKKKIREAVRIYNKGSLPPVAAALSFGVQPNGIGISLKF